MSSSIPAAARRRHRAPLLALGLGIACCTPTTAVAQSASVGAIASIAIPKPEWASVAGDDPQGHWADLPVDGVTQRMRWIAPGTFLMGSSKAEIEARVRAGWPEAETTGEAQHQVTLSRGFWLADSTCTQELWVAAMGSNPSFHTGDPKLPVEQVSWMAATEFLMKLNQQSPTGHFALPSEAQWEYACRSGADEPSTDEALAQTGWFFAIGGTGTHPVKQKRPNAWGLFDMHGNVWEWCQDRYIGYPVDPATDPEGPAVGAERVLRGGDWSVQRPLCHSAYRWKGDAAYTGLGCAALGFRISAQAPAQ